MNQIKERKVRRFYVNGKGYASAFQAARSLAKKELKSEAYKALKEAFPVVGRCEIYDMSSIERDLLDEEIKHFLYTWYANKFKDSVLIDRYGHLFRCDHPGTKRRVYLDERAREIMKEQGL